MSRVNFDAVSSWYYNYGKHF